MEPSSVTHCPRCGYPDEGDVIQALPTSTRHVWQHAGPQFHQGDPVSAGMIAEHCYLDRTTVYYHLHRLMDRGLIVTTPKVEGGRYKLYVKAEPRAA
jgi:DNA-binding transcriptional ArsR family regulator